MDQAIYPIHENQNRNQRRGFIREYEKVEPHLADLETKFELAIFTAPEALTYQDLYDYFHKKWRLLVERLLLEFEIKYSVIDIHHFPRKYRPIEGAPKKRTEPCTTSQAS